MATEVKAKNFDKMDEEKIISTVQRRLAHFHKSSLHKQYSEEALNLYINKDRDALIALSQDYWKKSTEE